MDRQRLDRRRAEQAFFKLLMGGATAIVLGSLLLILGTIAWKGGAALSLEMLTRPPAGGHYASQGGGILNSIVGSLLLGLISTAAAGAVSLPVVFYLNLYLPRRSRLALLVRYLMDVLWGIPSIVYGAFGFLVMVLLGLKASLLAGSLTVAMLVIPIMIRGMDEVFRALPAGLTEASLALGATRWETATRVIFRQSFPGILTAVLLAFGRGIGDAASVLFTAGFNDTMCFSLTHPVGTLPLAVFYQLNTPFPEVQARGYASALVLTLLVLATVIASRWLTRRYQRHVLK